MTQYRICSPRQILQPCELTDHPYQIDPYIGCEHCCHYCYALNHAETDWAQEILVHQDFADRVKRELSTIEPQSIYFGWNSDPYQPLEQTCQHTRQALELLAQRIFSVCILTKSNLVTRDIDVITQMPGSSVGFSIAFHEERIREIFEANAPSNFRKLAALKTLKEAGIETYVLICPIMPYITNVEACIEMVAPYADTIWFYALSMKTEQETNWKSIHKILVRYYPELVESYRQITFSSDHPYWIELRGRLEEFQSKTSLNMRIGL